MTSPAQATLHFLSPPATHQAAGASWEMRHEAWLGVPVAQVTNRALQTPLALALPGESVLEPGVLCDESLAEPEAQNIGFPK